MHVQRPGADLFPGFLRGFPRAEHVRRQPAGRRQPDRRAASFRRQPRQPEQQAAESLERNDFPLALAVRVTVFVAVVPVLVGRQEFQLARDELRPAQILPTPEAHGRLAGLFLNEGVAEHALDHHAPAARASTHRRAALRAVAVLSGTEQREPAPW